MYNFIAPLKNKVYYSQNREDLILSAFFPEVKKGFYVDVGAYDPDKDSVTKLFYKRGWAGINIEPQNNKFALFQKKRIRDTNLNIGISNKSGTLTLRSYENQGLSTLSKEIKAKYEDDKAQLKYDDIVVEVSTLKNIFKQHNVEKIHFLKVDVEGFEYEVLEGNDWNKFRPEVICLEANHIIKNWKPILITNKYVLAFHDGLNEYYTDSGTNRKTNFDYVNHIVVERGGGLNTVDYELINKLHKDNTHLHKHIEYLDHLLSIAKTEKEHVDSPESSEDED